MFLTGCTNFLSKSEIMYLNSTIYICIETYVIVYCNKKVPPYAFHMYRTGDVCTFHLCSCVCCFVRKKGDLLIRVLNCLYTYTLYLILFEVNRLGEKNAKPKKELYVIFKTSIS